MAIAGNIDWLELVEELAIEVCQSDPESSSTPITRHEVGTSTPAQQMAKEIANHLSHGRIPDEAFEQLAAFRRLPYRKVLIEAFRNHCPGRVLSQVARQLREDRLVDQHQFRNVIFAFILVVILAAVWQFSFAQMIQTFQAIGPFRPSAVPWWMPMMEQLLAWSWLWAWCLPLSAFFALRHWMQRVKRSSLRLQQIHEWQAVELVSELAKSWPLGQAVHVAQRVWGVDLLMHVEAMLEPPNRPQSLELANALIAKEAIQCRRLQTQFRRWWSEQLPRQIAVCSGSIAVVLYLLVAIFPLTMFLIEILQPRI